jgi:hypothetical protein
MGYDITQPTDSTKLRRAPAVIRPNWQAIQEGDSTFIPKAINFNNRTVSGPTNDPTAITNAFVMYSKEDALGNAELFGINESSQILQFTKGIPTFGLIDHLLDGQSFIPGGLILKWGVIGLTNQEEAKLYSTGAFPTNTLGVFLSQFTSDNIEDSETYATNYSATGFVARRYGPTTNTYRYLALGY